MKFKRPSTGSKTRLLSREQLAIWLDALDPPAAGISTIDGFLAAMAVSPRFIEPEAWMVTILGERARNVLEGTRMAAAIRSILARYEQICDELAESPETYAPVYMRTDDGEVLLEEFANGFFTGMRLALDAWMPFVSDPEIGYPLAMLVGHSSQTGGPTWIDQLADPTTKGALADAWRVVPDIILMVHDRCYETRTDSMIPADLFNPS